MHYCTAHQSKQPVPRPCVHHRGHYLPVDRVKYRQRQRASSEASVGARGPSYHRCREEFRAWCSSIEQRAEEEHAAAAAAN